MIKGTMPRDLYNHARPYASTGTVQLAVHVLVADNFKLFRTSNFRQSLESDQCGVYLIGFLDDNFQWDLDL